MPDSTWFLTFRIAVQSLVPFFAEKTSLNSTCIVESDGRGTSQFYNVSHVSLTQLQSSKFGNKCSEICFNKHVDPLSFCRMSVAFSHCFSTIIFLFGYFLFGKIKTALNLAS